MKDLGQARLTLFHFLNELSSGFMSLCGSENQIEKVTKKSLAVVFLNER